MINRSTLDELRASEIEALQETFFRQNGYYLPYNVNEFKGIEGYKKALEDGARPDQGQEQAR